MNIDLTPFCRHYPTAMWTDIDKPCHIGRWLYATDGHICVRVPAGKTGGTRPKGFPKCEGLLWPKAADWKAMNPAPMGDTTERTGKMPCPACNGDGYKKNGHKCKTCKGNGRIEGPYLRDLTVSGRTVTIQQKDAEAISKLPGLLLATTGRGEMIRFRFKGGQGLLMAVDTGGKP